MTSRSLLAAVPLVIASAASCLCIVTPTLAQTASPSPTASVSPRWIGTWQLDRSRSHLVGSTIIIGRVPDGYNFDFGAVSFNIADDGRDHVTLGDRTTSIKPLGPRTWSRVHKVAGKEVDHSTLTVSADEHTLSIQTTATALDGAVHSTTETMTRVGPGTGLAGTWRSTNPGINVTTIITIADAGSGRLTWIFPDQGQRYTVGANGSPVPETGPGVPATTTIALRRISDRELHWTESLKGQPFTEGIDRLSEDGRSLEETTWPSHTPADRQQAVYTRR